MTPNAIVRVHVHLHGAREIGVFQRRRHRLQVPRQPQIVVALVADDAPSSLAQHVVAVHLAVARPFRQVEEADAPVVGLKLPRNGTDSVVYAVADDQDFDVVDRCPCTLATARASVAACSWVGIRTLALGMPGFLSQTSRRSRSA